MKKAILRKTISVDRWVEKFHLELDDWYYSESSAYLNTKIGVIRVSDHGEVYRGVEISIDPYGVSLREFVKWLRLKLKTVKCCLDCDATLDLKDGYCPKCRKSN